MKEGIYLTKFEDRTYDDITYATKWNKFSNEVLLDSAPEFEEPYEREEDELTSSSVSCELILPKEYMT